MDTLEHRSHWDAGGLVYEAILWKDRTPIQIRDEFYPSMTLRPYTGNTRSTIARASYCIGYEVIDARGGGMQVCCLVQID